MGSDDLHKKSKKITLDEYKPKSGRKGPPIDKLLIVCEGEETEPNYFNSFPINLGELQVKVIGTGYNTLSLVKKTIEIIKKDEKAGIKYNQKWCVFDKDSFQNFDNAIKMAHAHNIRTAYSNEAFELWFILHFNYLHTPLERSQYKHYLDKYLNSSYSKNSKNMYKELLKNEKTAIDNAKRLFALQKKKNLPDSKLNPITTVHLLVEELNKWIE